IESGRALAAKAPGDADLKSFQDIQHLWTQDDALRIELLEANEKVFDFNVTRCRYAETYREMGLGEIGHLLSCNRDGAFCEGYNPAIKLKRSQTIMGGASHCDFRYRFEEEKK
ncbi:MAG TPA: L-2-amino-thiazoline-4-carboxylic acid hydrolase, partial [Roseiarcus sp.]|nr:L-2-amino-thiazoline-4-carboxylic acid hydrolase [Roseiarcus sp.]